MKPIVALVTIGQSPRPMHEAELARALPPGVQIIHKGALDDLTRAEIDAARPENGADTLFTFLRDGSAVDVSHKTVTAGVNRRLAELDAEGVTVALLLCTGVFEGLSYKGLLLQPSETLDAVVHSVFRKGRMGVLVPLASQIDSLPDKWRAEGVEIVARALQPGSDDAAIDAAVARLVGPDPDIPLDIIVMDCMGYSAADKARVRNNYDGPVVLALTSAARIMGELIE